MAIRLALGQHSRPKALVQAAAASSVHIPSIPAVWFRSILNSTFPLPASIISKTYTYHAQPHSGRYHRNYYNRLSRQRLLSSFNCSSSSLRMPSFNESLLSCGYWRTFARFPHNHNDKKEKIVPSAYYSMGKEPPFLFCLQTVCLVIK